MIILPEHYDKKVIIQYDGKISSPDSEHKDYPGEIMHMFNILKYSDDCTCLIEDDTTEKNKEDIQRTNSSIEPYSFDSIYYKKIILNIPHGIHKKEELILKEWDYKVYRLRFIPRIRRMFSRSKLNLYMLPLVYVDNHYYIELYITTEYKDDWRYYYWIEFTKDMEISKWCYFVST